MRVRVIDYNADQPLDDVFLGYIGEHNETALRVIPPDEMLTDANIASFVLAYGVGTKVYHSEVALKTEVATLGWFEALLYKDLTVEDELSIQLEAYNANSSLIAKTEMVYGYFEPSVDGEDAIASGDPGIIADITANTAARHTHSNKAILDAITSIPNTVEIWDSGTNAKYTATELAAMTNHQQTHFAYKGYPVIAYGSQIAPPEFYFTYLKTANTINMDIVQYIAKCKVQDNKKITEGTTKTIPIKVNGQTADNNGNISLPIPAAQIQSDWNQADTEALDYIKNKPSIPAAQVQADWNQATSTEPDYIKNKPTIPSISGCEVTSNKVTALSNASTDTQYPSAKCVYDIIGDVESILADLIGGA